MNGGTKLQTWDHVESAKEADNILNSERSDKKWTTKIERRLLEGDKRSITTSSLEEAEKSTHFQIWQTMSTDKDNQENCQSKNTKMTRQHRSKNHNIGQNEEVSEGETTVDLITHVLKT